VVHCLLTSLFPRARAARSTQPDEAVVRSALEFADAENLLVAEQEVEGLNVVSFCKDGAAGGEEVEG
jgi:hypothetical protein